MRNTLRVRRRAVWGLAAMLLATGAGVAAWSGLGAGLFPILGMGSGPSLSEGALEALGRYGEVPDFRLTERGGRVITRTELLGTVWIANFWEFNVRLKTDSSQDGPAKGAPVVIRAGMVGDRVSIVFATPEEISATIQHRC